MPSAVLSAARDTPLARELEAQLAAADGEGSGGLPAELRVRVCAEYRRLKAAGSVVDDADENAVRNIEGGAAMVTAGARDSLASEIEVDGAPATPSVRAELPAPAPPGGDGDSSVPNAAPSPPAALLPPAPLSSTPGPAVAVALAVAGRDDFRLEGDTEGAFVLAWVGWEANALRKRDAG